MFSKTSRYRKLPDTITIDAKGRNLESKTVRLLPHVTGAFLHTIEEVDRIDHLAYKFYKQSRKWWRICDANPEYMSPQALLGKDSVKTIYVAVHWEGLIPPWSGLLRKLDGMTGIEYAGLGTSGQPYPETIVIDGMLLFSVDASLTAELNTAVRTQEFPAALRQALDDNGLTIVSAVRSSFIENEKWRITDLISKQVYTLRLQDGALNVYESLTRHIWVLKIIYNQMNATTQKIRDRITALGFRVEQPLAEGRIGKQLIIPSDINP